MLSQDITESLLAVIMLQLVSILSYRFVLWVEGSIQMWPHCRLRIVYCYGLRTWIFGWTPWSDADQTFTICTPLLTGHDADVGVGITWGAGHLQSSPRRLCRCHRRLEYRGCEWTKYRSNNVALCNIIVCVGRRGHAVAPCRRVAVYRGLLGGVQWPSLR